MAEKSKVKKPRRLSEDRVDEAISDFQETLVDFCAAILSSGSRNGNEWVVPDLDNSPRHDGKPGSCCVNLETGCFYDHNPAAEPQKGGPVQLWGTLFGLNYKNKTDFVEIIIGMEAWVKDGSLPDGSRGVAISGRVKLCDEETLVALDDYEKELVTNIRGFKNWVEYYGANPDPTKREGFTPGHLHWGYVLYEDYDWTTHNKGRLAQSLKLIRCDKSELYAHRWLKAVAETKAQREGAAILLAEYRGLSPDLFRWLIDNGLIVFYQSQRSSTRTGGRWEDIEIGFPVMTNSPRLPLPSDLKRHATWLQRQFGESWPGKDIEFLGMHLKWFSNSGNSGWRYEPKGNGCGSVPFIIGDLAKADLVVIGESTWDVISFIDLYRLFDRAPDRPWAAIDTGGASNAKRIPADRIKPEAVILLLLQNDPNGANEHWCAGLQFTVRERGRRIIPPTGIKDLNDWMRAAPAKEIKKILEHK
jgi:hypothetical protein